MADIEKTSLCITTSTQNTNSDDSVRSFKSENFNASLNSAIRETEDLKQYQSTNICDSSSTNNSSEYNVGNVVSHAKTLLKSECLVQDITETVPGSSSQAVKEESLGNHGVCITTDRQNTNSGDTDHSFKSELLNLVIEKTEPLNQCQSVNICGSSSNEFPEHNVGKEVPHVKTSLNSECSVQDITEPVPGSSSQAVKEESSENHVVWLPATNIKIETDDNSKSSKSEKEDEESEDEFGEEERLEESEAEMGDESNGGAYHLAEVSYGEENEDVRKAGGPDYSILGIAHDVVKTESPRYKTSDGLNAPEGQLADDFVIQRKNFKIKDLKSGKVHYKNFECLICGYKSPQRSALIDHIHKHTGEKMHHCLHCDKKFRYKSYLSQHITIYHTDSEAQFSCELCGRRFVKESAFVRHQRTHSGERPFPCDFCDYQARHRGALKEHLRIHTGEKPYECKTCNYKCAYSTLLKRHFAKHHDVKTFKCQCCKYVTNQIRNFQDHMKTHNGEKLYQCDNCSYKSIRKDSLKAHIVNVHADPTLSCTVCDAKFKYTKTLSKHIYEQHPDEYPFQCELCSLRFKRPRGLSLHNRKRHT